MIELAAQGNEECLELVTKENINQRYICAQPLPLIVQWSLVRWL